MALADETHLPGYFHFYDRRKSKFTKAVLENPWLFLGYMVDYADQFYGDSYKSLLSGQKRYQNYVV